MTLLELDNIATEAQVHSPGIIRSTTKDNGSLQRQLVFTATIPDQIHLNNQKEILVLLTLVWPVN